MLAYRKQSITAAANNVVKKFNLGKGEAFLIARHLMLILFELIRNVYLDSGVSRKTIEKQKELYDRLFDTDLYQDNLANNQRWAEYLSQSKLMGYMLNQQFDKLNKAFRYSDANLSLRRVAYNVLKKKREASTAHSFDMAVTFINGL